MPIKKLSPKPFVNTKADSARKTKEAQAIGMGKVKAKKAANAASKRMTAQAKMYGPAKKAPSSAALGLTPMPRKKKRNA